MAFKKRANLWMEPYMQLCRILGERAFRTKVGHVAFKERTDYRIESCVLFCRIIRETASRTQDSPRALRQKAVGVATWRSLMFTKLRSKQRNRRGLEAAQMKKLENAIRASVHRRAAKNCSRRNVSRSAETFFVQRTLAG